MSDITPQMVMERLQRDAEGHALRGNADAAYQAIVGLALARQLLAIIQGLHRAERDDEAHEEPAGGVGGEPSNGAHPPSMPVVATEGNPEPPA